MNFRWKLDWKVLVITVLVIIAVILIGSLVKHYGG